MAEEALPSRAPSSPHQAEESVRHWDMQSEWAGTQFTRFTSTKVQILKPEEQLRASRMRP